MSDFRTIDSIKSGLADCMQLAQAPAMNRLRDVLAASIRKLDEPMQLAIIGKISSSKSTLVNAILGKNELMSTGQKEVTYNVGWLKYGDSSSDIVLHFKDGRPAQKKSRKEFDKLSVESNTENLDEISYIETFDDSEILKTINIIDTPGLDALRGKDSQNTLDFISKVRPDAVVMLFTHSVSESILDVVRQFNAGSDFTPLNAIGVLSKIDVLWQETIPRTKSALEIGKKMVENKMKKDLTIKKSLFNLYPISALLFMASSTITAADIDSIGQAYNESPENWCKMLNSMPKFLGDAACSMSIEARKQLGNKLGLYGIYLITQRFKQGGDTSLSAIKQLFFTESGASEFSKSLHNHFGSRAKLIKIESIYQHLIQEIRRLKASSQDVTVRSLLLNLEQKISDIFSSFVHEHKEYEMLNAIYGGELELDDDVVEEFKCLCGERGDSAPAKLGIATVTDVNELLNVALSRERFWRKNIALEPDPEEREWMNVILKSYSLLRNKISEMKYRYEQAKSFLYNE